MGLFGLFSAHFIPWLDYQTLNEYRSLRNYFLKVLKLSSQMKGWQPTKNVIKCPLLRISFSLFACQNSILILLSICVIRSITMSDNYPCSVCSEECHDHCIFCEVSIIDGILMFHKNIFLWICSSLHIFSCEEIRMASVVIVIFRPLYL